MDDPLTVGRIEIAPLPDGSHPYMEKRNRVIVDLSRQKAELTRLREQLRQKDELLEKMYIALANLAREYAQITGHYDTQAEMALTQYQAHKTGGEG